MAEDRTPKIRGGRRVTAKRAGGLGLLVAMVLVYVGVLVLYGHSTEPDKPLADITDQEAEGKVLVGLDFTGFSTTDSSMNLEMQVIPPEELIDNQGYLTQDMEILIVAVDPDPERSGKAIPFQGTSVKLEAGNALLSSQVKLHPSGQRQNYPFDVYEGYLGLAAVVKDDGERRTVPSLLVVGGDAPGWVVQSDRTTEHPSPDLDLGDSAAKYEVSRAGSTATIVLLILGAMVVMVLCAAWVSRSVLRKRRRIEATMASWFAALLFAVIPLRLNMPGAPPMGAWMDFAVVLWVEMGLMTALAIFIYSWLTYTPKPDYAPPDPVAEEGAEPQDATAVAATGEPPEPGQPGSQA